jgi:hypothetical protein
MVSNSTNAPFGQCSGDNIVNSLVILSGTFLLKDREVLEDGL